MSQCHDATAAAISIPSLRLEQPLMAELTDGKGGLLEDCLLPHVRTSNIK